MDIHYSTVDEPATPEYVLAVLQDEHRQQCQYDDAADPQAVLSFDTTVAEWREACDLIEWRELGQAYNKLWQIDCSDAEWRAVFEPARQRRLSDVCQLIASRAIRPTIRPLRILGNTCVPAGAFLTIRSLLHKSGADTAEITPSTPLAPYARRFCNVFLCEVSRLAPGALPSVRIWTPVYDAVIWGILIGMACVPVAMLSGAPLVAAAGVIMLVLGYALSWFAARLLPTSVEFGTLRTFRELAVVVAEGRPPEPTTTRH